MVWSVVPKTPAAVAEAADRLADAAVRRRFWVLGGLVVLYWAVVAYEALRSAPHNGWLYYQGGDAGWYWTIAYTLTHWQVPVTAVGLGWSYVLMPFAAIGGPNMINGLPGVVVFNVGVLGAATVLGMYLLGHRLGGRLFGLWSAAVWVIAPVIAIALYTPHNRTGLLGGFMPTGRGLNALSDYPSMVCAIFAAVFVMRAIDSGTWLDGAGAGVLIGFLVDIKPSNGFFAVAAAVGLVAAQRVRALATAALAMAPALLALALWKHTGIGTVPVFSYGQVHEAAGAVVAVSGPQRYLHLDWHHLARNIRYLQEVFWSVRVLQFVLLGGTIALLVRARAKGLFVVVWFLAYAIFKGSAAVANVEDASLYRFILPAFPAWYLLAASLVFLWPRGRDARRREADADTLRAASVRRLPRMLLVACAALFSLAPLAVAATVSRVPRETVALEWAHGAVVPIVGDFRIRARVTGPGRVRVNWRRVSTPYAEYAYKVYKGRRDGCHYAATGAPICNLFMRTFHSTPTLGLVDPHANGHLVYRVALVATWRVDPNAQDVILLSKPVSVDAP